MKRAVNKDGLQQKSSTLTCHISLDLCREKLLKSILEHLTTYWIKIDFLLV